MRWTESNLITGNGGSGSLHNSSDGLYGVFVYCMYIGIMISNFVILQGNFISTAGPPQGDPISVAWQLDTIRLPSCFGHTA